MSDESEEKSLPATDKKLNEARHKGQVQHSQDFVSAIVLLFSTVYILLSVPAATGRVKALVTIAANVHTQPFATILKRLVADSLWTLVIVSLPLVGLLLFAVVLGNMVVMKGFVFAVEPIKPNLDHINPAKGFKRIFSMRSLVEFLKSIAKAGIMASALMVVLAGSSATLLRTPTCGNPCLAATLWILVQRLAIAAIPCFLILSLADILLQRSLFQREMKMTKSEAKRERKDTDGSPQIRNERQRLRNELSLSTAKTGFTQATILIGARDGSVVGLRYKKGETSVPILVWSGRFDQETDPTHDLSSLAIPIIVDEALSANLLRLGRIGSPVPQPLFQPVADILVGLRLV